jgi:hypothetical protein
MLRPYLFCRGNAPDLRELVHVPGSSNPAIFASLMTLMEQRAM